MAPESGAFDTVTARAVSQLDDLARLCGPLVRAGGRLVALKGPAVAGELPAIDRLHVADHRVSVPGLEGERHIVTVTGWSGG